MESTCACCGASVSGKRCDDCGAVLQAGSYRVLGLISATPRGRLYLAESEGQQVALKEMAFLQTPDEKLLDLLRREGEILQQLNHPRIPRFLDSFEVGQGIHRRLYLAQEHISGPNLLEELQERRFTEEEVLHVARQVLEVLVHLQQLQPGLVHRDVKPANLVRRPDGQVVLVDFGSARDVVLGTYGGTMQVGTYAYMPPEQLAGEVDQTSDLYALGGTLFHLMSRKSPRECFAPGGGSRLRELGGSPGLCHFVAKLMAPEHSARFRSAQMALSALEKGLEFPVVVRTSRLPTSMRGMVVGSVLVTGTAVGVGSWLWSFPQIRNDLHEIVGTGPVDGDESEEHAHWPPIEIPEDIQDVERQLEEFAAFSEKRKIDELSLEAQDNLHLLEDAQEAWKGSKGSYLLFKEATPETWSRLGIEPIGELVHNYRASLQDGELLLEAWGNLDDDESLDIWWAGPANGGGGAGQLATDALDMVLYPEAEGRYPPPEESD